MRATRNGGPFKADVYVHRQGEKKPLAHRYATIDRPAEYALLPGRYDIRVRDDSAKRKPATTKE